FFSSRRRHTRFSRDWSSDVCSSDLIGTNRGFTLVLVGRCAGTTEIRNLYKTRNLYRGRTRCKIPRHLFERRSAQLNGLGRSTLRSEEHTSELQSRENLVCRLLLEKK